jgi:hypothetical protein
MHWPLSSAYGLKALGIQTATSQLQVSVFSYLGHGFIRMSMNRVATVGACIALALLPGCGRPDTQALKKLACEQVANTIDLQSVAQLDALRKALGLAPGVDPIESCRALGATMGAGSQGENSREGGSSRDEENLPAEGNGKEN